MARDSISSVVIFCACIFFYALTFRINVIAGFEDMAPSLWPRFNIIGMAILSVLIFVRSLWTRRDRKDAGSTEKTPFPAMAMAGTVGVIFCFIWLAPYAGFLLTAFLATMAFMRLLGEKNKRALFGLPFLLVVLIYLVFGKLMSVPIPRGVGLFEKISFLLY